MRNSVLLVFFIMGIVLFTVCAATGIEPNWKMCLLNASVTAFIAIMFYLFRIWAGADCKLIMVIVLYIPYGYYIKPISNAFCLSFILVFAFAISYAWLIIDSIISRVVLKQKPNALAIKEKFLVFAERYYCIVSYITLVNGLISLISLEESIVTYISILTSITILIMVNNIRIMRNKYAATLALLVGFAVKSFSGLPPFTIIMIVNYALVLLMSLTRMIIDEYNYEEINVQSLKKGMILSTATTMMFANSAESGLPEVSKEDLGSRLTQQEVESVVSWALAKDKQNVVIVRKLPFAIFISIGVILFLVLGHLI